jgi:hypothetical protein
MDSGLAWSFLNTVQTLCAFSDSSVQPLCRSEEEGRFDIQVHEQQPKEAPAKAHGKRRQERAALNLFAFSSLRLCGKLNFETELMPEI